MSGPERLLEARGRRVGGRDARTCEQHLPDGARGAIPVCAGESIARRVDRRATIPARQQAVCLGARVVPEPPAGEAVSVSIRSRQRARKSARSSSWMCSISGGVAGPDCPSSASRICRARAPRSYCAPRTAASAPIAASASGSLVARAFAVQSRPMGGSKSCGASLRVRHGAPAIARPGAVETGTRPAIAQPM